MLIDSHVTSFVDRRPVFCNGQCQERLPKLSLVVFDLEQGRAVTGPRLGKPDVFELGKETKVIGENIGLGGESAT